MVRDNNPVAVLPCLTVESQILDLARYVALQGRMYAAGADPNRPKIAATRYSRLGSHLSSLQCQSTLRQLQRWAEIGFQVSDIAYFYRRLHPSELRHRLGSLRITCAIFLHDGASDDLHRPSSWELAIEKIDSLIDAVSG